MWTFLAILSFALTYGSAILVGGFFSKNIKHNLFRGLDADYGLHILDIDEELSDSNLDANDHRDLIFMLSSIMLVIIGGLFSILFLISLDNSVIDDLFILFSKSLFNNTGFAIGLGVIFFLITYICCIIGFILFRLAIEIILNLVKKIKNSKLKYASLVIGIYFGWLTYIIFAIAFSILALAFYEKPIEQCYKQQTKISIGPISIDCNDTDD